jgi:hypothetical protein
MTGKDSSNHGWLAFHSIKATYCQYHVFVEFFGGYVTVEILRFTICGLFQDCRDFQQRFAGGVGIHDSISDGTSGTMNGIAASFRQFGVRTFKYISASMPFYTGQMLVQQLAGMNIRNLNQSGIINHNDRRIQFIQKITQLERDFHHFTRRT